METNPLLLLLSLLLFTTILWDANAHDLSLSQETASLLNAPPPHSLLHSAASRIFFASSNKFLNLQQQQNSNHDKTNTNNRQLQGISSGDFERNICPTFEALYKDSASSLDYFREAGGLEKVKCACDSIEFAITCGFTDLCTTIYPSCENLTICTNEIVRTNFLSGLIDSVTRVNLNTSDPGVAYPGSFIRAVASTPPTCERRYTFAEDGLEYICNSCEVCEDGTQTTNCTNIQPAFVRDCAENSTAEETAFFQTNQENPARFCFPPENNITAPKPTSIGMPPSETDLIFETLREILLATESPSTSPTGIPSASTSVPSVSPSMSPPPTMMPSVSPNMSPTALTSLPVSMPTSAGNYLFTTSLFWTTVLTILVPALF